MRIGVDAKYYYSGTPSLINVVKNIVNSLIEYNKEDEIVFFLSLNDFHFREDFNMKIANKKNMSFVFIPGKFNFLVNLIFFPIYFNKKNLDVILFQNYIPIWGGHKIKYVDYTHDFLFLDYPQYFTKIQKAIYWLMLYSAKKASHVITISQSERNRIIKHSNIPPSKISYVHHGLDPVFYERSDKIKAEIKKKYNLPGKYILYVGRLNVRKNIKTLLKSFSTVSHNINLVIIGKEENQEFNLKEEVTKLGISNKVYKIDHVADKDLAEIISSATIFVFPSFAEGFGLPPLEAMKCGVPTIVSNRMALPEICGDAALYFDPEDPSDLSAKMDFILTNNEAYDFYKMKGKSRSEEFSWRKSVENILTIVKSVKNKSF